MPLTLPTITLCDNFGNTYDGITIFDLTQQNDLILAANGGNLDGFIIRYYTSEANALAGTNWIGDPTQYQNLSNPQTIWVTVENTSNPGGCTRMRSFEIAVNSSIFLTQPTPITVCESTLPNDGVELFDLTIRELQILGGVQTFATFKYYTSAYDRENDINEITNAEFYTSTSPNQTIYIKVIAENGCESLTTLQLRVLPLPEVVTAPTPLQACEVEYGEGVARFNLRDAQAEIGMEDVNLSYRYFLTYDEAVLNQGAIGTPTDHLSASGSVFVRISKIPATEPNCFVIVELPLIMNPLPAIGPMTPLLACEENTDGRFTFNLEDKNEEALAGQNENNFSVRYYLNEQNAELATNQLPFIYTNVIQEQQIIFVRVENKNTGCYSISELILRVEEEVKAFPPSNTVFCEMDYVNDGVTPMDLTVMDADIISTQNAAPLAVRYYRADGTLIVDPTNYVGTNGEVITAEVYRDEEGYLCTGMVSFTIYTKAGAEIKEIPNGIICYNYRDNSIVEQSYTMDTGLPNTSDFTFVWTLNGNVVGTESTYTAVEAGTYTVTVTVNSTGCSNSRTIVVAEGPAISIDEIIYSESFEERMAIEVIAYGGNGVELEYALDEGPWQESGIFDDVTPGEHVVRVRVKGSELSCPAVEIIQVMSHPQFFTPNADGFNDTWNITSLKYQPEAKIYIFDRYGKLIKELSPSGPGWDGTFNGVPMPATDYWFKATYVDPQTGLQKEATGHFSLKR